MAATNNGPFRRRFVKTVIRAAISTLLIFILSVAVMAQQAAPKSNFNPAISPQENGERREHHPHIRSAINELQEARRELQSAAHDFSGHRVDALKARNEAIHQLQLALQYDKK
jgi:hypothetical protein